LPNRSSTGCAIVSTTTIIIIIIIVPSSHEGRNLKEFLVFLVVGSVGAFAGLCTIVYFLWFGAKRVLVGEN